jgi:hypothetical protein
MGTAAILGTLVASIFLLLPRKKSKPKSSAAGQDTGTAGECCQVTGADDGKR